MKKLISTLLIAIIGSLGYVVVDKTFEERLTDLEAVVVSQQAIIERYEKENKPGLDYLEIGDSLPCLTHPGDVVFAGNSLYIPNTAEEHIKITIKEFSCKLIKRSKNNWPIFNISLSGFIDEGENYDGARITAVLAHNNDVNYIEGSIKDNFFEIYFETDLYGYFTITEYTEIDIITLTIRG